MTFDVVTLDVVTFQTLPVLAHAGPGSTWQAMVVVAGITLAGCLLAAGAGWLAIEQRDDLVVPLAATAILSSFGTVAGEWLSDAIGWALPLAVVSLVALLVAAFTRLDVRFPAPLPMGAIALGTVSAMILYQPLTVGLHPPAALLPLSDDAAVVVVEPTDGTTLEDGTVSVVVEVTGGSLGADGTPLDELPDDPEEAGALAVAIEAVTDDDTPSPQQGIEVDYHETCSLERPCERVSFDVALEPGTYELTVELVRGDGTPLAPFVRDRISFTTS